MSKDPKERRHRRTWRHAESIACESEEDARVMAAAWDSLAVADQLDRFQRSLNANGVRPTFGDGITDKFFSAWLADIVTAARAAIAKATSPPTEETP